MQKTLIKNQFLSGTTFVLKKVDSQRPEYSFVKVHSRDFFESKFIKTERKSIHH